MKSRYIYGAFAGLLMAYSHNHAPWLAVFGIAMITHLVRGRDTKKNLILAFVYSSIEGVAFWAFIMPGLDGFAAAWTMHVGFRMLFVMLLPFAYAREKALPWIAASWWVAVEYLRTSLALNPVPLADAFANQLWFVQTADLGGTYLVSFVLIVMSVSLTQVYQSRRWLLFVPAASLFALSVVYSGMRLEAADSTTHVASQKIAIQQSSIPYWFYKLAEGDQEFSGFLMKAYTSSLKEVSNDIDLLVWPETALPWDPTKYKSLEQSISATTGPDLLAGLPRHQTGGMTYNSAWLFARAAAANEPIQFYDKRITFPVIEAKLGKGTKAKLLQTADLKLAPVICWESVFPNLVRHAANADMMVILTDPSAFGAANLASIHAKRTAMRAIERRKPAIHASQAGPSRLIDAYGRIRSELSEWKYGRLQGELAVHSLSSIYSQSRGVFAPFVSVLAVLLLGLCVRIKES